MNEHVGAINQLTEQQRRSGQQPPRLREGFVDTASQAKTIEPSKTIEPPKPPASHPAPEIEASPAELDAAGPSTEELWPIVVKLTFKPIRNNRGEVVNELSFREPKGGDINRYGNPVRMNSQGDWVIEERKMHYVMAALSDILPPFLDQMDPRDWNFCAYELMRFFLPSRRVS
jgi:hypothetical protein